MRHVFYRRLRGNRLRGGACDLLRLCQRRSYRDHGARFGDADADRIATATAQLVALASVYNASFQIVLAFMPSFFVDNGFQLARATSLSAVIAIGFVVGVQAGGRAAIKTVRSSGPDLLCSARELGSGHTRAFEWHSTLAVGRARWPARGPPCGGAGLATDRSGIADLALRR